MNRTEIRAVSSARKHHHCSRCGTMIEKGSPYYRYRGFDGTGQDYIPFNEEVKEEIANFLIQKYKEK